MRILIATKNKGKFGEIKGGLLGEGVGFLGRDGSARADFEIEFLGDYQVDDGDFVEDGVTHEENARKKAKYYWGKFCGASRVSDGGRVCRDGGCGGGPVFDFVLGEDSGIYVDALRDELGVQTRRWGAGEMASDEEWLEYFMREMGVRAPAFDQRGAKFVCNACLVGGSSSGGGGGEIFEELFCGETLGHITDQPMAEILPGLPLSSVFLPEGFDKVYAGLSREEKNKISHRGQAVGKVREWLVDLRV